MYSSVEEVGRYLETYKVYENKSPCLLYFVLYSSVEEVGRYLETYKVYENKPAEALMEKTDTDYVSKVL